MRIRRASLNELARLAHDFPRSFVVLGDAVLWLEADDGRKQLAVLADPASPVLQPFAGVEQTFGEGYVVRCCATDAATARALRDTLPWLRPVPLGLTTSAGCGDRLGLTTPGHVRALHTVLADAPRRTIAPIFAQQSIREMGRTCRTPVDVLTDATCGAFQAGWRGTLGADADHLKTTADIDATVTAGFSFFTIDPGAYVDDEADGASTAGIRRKVEALPWTELESDPRVLRLYVGLRVELEDRSITLGEEVAMRAAAKYGAAIAHAARMYRHLAGKHVPFDLEISVGETASPTTHQEHIFFVQKLRRLGVQGISLAPRYTGRFEKGVDYIGNLDALRTDLAGHAAIARALGPYKLSLHSSSDKFSVYPVIAEVARGLVHLKTAGTSYLEALRLVARIDPPFFRELLAFAHERYAEDRASYHVWADLARVPAPEDVSDEQLPGHLEAFDARQVLHVTFGSARARFRPRLFELLRANEETYAETVSRHFVRHLRPFVRTG